MKKKGFTLVELLAVIAILAILVIVAMPNVLGMFNQAKVSSFVTEVQKIMDTATTTFTKDALKNSGKAVYYSSTDNATLGTKTLDMSGNKKNYFIEMDRNGNFKRVVVSDANYCYDIYTTDSIFARKTSVSKFIKDKIEKTSVFAADVWEAGSDSIIVNIDGTNYSLNGCEGIITAEGKDKIEVTSTMKINGVNYEYVPGMTWSDWIGSKYNTDNFTLGSNKVYMTSPYAIAYHSTVCYGCTTEITYHYDEAVSFVSGNHQIIKNEIYDRRNANSFYGFLLGGPGDRVYDFNDNGGKVIYEQELKVMP